MIHACVQFETGFVGEESGTVNLSIVGDARISFIPYTSSGDGYISAIFSEEEFAKLLRQMIRDKIAMPEAALPETVPPKQQALRAWQDAQATERQAQQEWEQAWRQAQLAAAQGAWQAAQGAWQGWEQAQLAGQQARQAGEAGA